MIQDDERVATGNEFFRNFPTSSAIYEREKPGNGSDVGATSAQRRRNVTHTRRALGEEVEEKSVPIAASRFRSVQCQSLASSSSAPFTAHRQMQQRVA